MVSFVMAAAQHHIGGFRNVITVERPRSAEIQAFAAFWEKKRAARRAPPRSAIDPAEIVDHLPHILLLDVLDGGRDFRFRLVGTAVVRATGRDVTGRTFSDVYKIGSPAFTTMRSIHHRVVAECHPIFVRCDVFWLPQDDPREFEGGFFPLSRDGETVDMQICRVEYEWPN